MSPRSGTAVVTGPWPGALALFLIATVAAGQEAVPVRGLQVRHRIDPGFPVAGWSLTRPGSASRVALLVFGRHGEVRTWQPPGSAGPEAALLGTLTLPHPARSLLALAPLAGVGAAPDLLVACPDGLLAYASGPGGVITTPPRTVLPRPRFSLRTGEPKLAPLVQDLNRDGRADLVLLNGDQLELWLQEAPPAGGGAPGEPPAPPPSTFRQVASLTVDVDRLFSTRSELLSDELTCSFTIPQLDIRDVSGDGRDDLVAQSGRRTAFHLQREDGTFPSKPDVEVDLKLFKDTTPPAAVRPGRTLAGGDDTRLQSRDLDGDGIPDYVIAHRRKVWIFPGTKAGPQFSEPSAILKTADDMTVLLLARLDDDPLPDLLILKVQVPTVATLVLGMLGNWDVEISAAGYENVGGRTFSTAPKWRRDLTLNLPPIAGVLRNPEALIRRFEEVGRKFRPEAALDLDGDGRQDVILASEDGSRLEAWLGQDARLELTTTEALDRVVRRLLFEDETTAWDVDRVLQWIQGLANERVAEITRNRPPDTTLALRSDESYAFAGMAPADLDGDGRAELVVAYRDRRPPHTVVLDVVGY